jgi:SAM-dependent methyltransferase
MEKLYKDDLAYIQSVGFEGFARGAASEIVRVLRNASIQIHRVLDVGCGAGCLTKVLAERGFEVTGIDRSFDLLEIARSTAPAARFVNASAYEFQFDACEAIVALGESLTYHADSAAADSLVEDFFRAASGVLPAGGMLIFDVIELGQPSLEGRSWASGDNWAVLVHTTENQPERNLVRNIETFRRVGEFYRRGLEVHRVRLFDTRTLCDQLAACGFSTETAQSYGSHPLLPRRRAFFATRTDRR